MIPSRTTVNMIILDAEDRVLLACRNDPEHHGSWSLPGGGVETNENLEAALRREINEELGCHIATLHYFRTYHNLAPGRGTIHSAYYHGTITGPISLNEREFSEYNWVPLKTFLAEAQRLAFNHDEVLRDFAATKYSEVHS